MSPNLMCLASDADYEYIGSFQRTIQELWMCDVMFAALMARPAGFLYTSFTPQALASADYLISVFSVLNQIIALLNGSRSSLTHRDSRVESLDSKLSVLRAYIPSVLRGPVDVDYIALRAHTGLGRYTVRCQITDLSMCDNHASCISSSKPIAFLCPKSCLRSRCGAGQCYFLE